MISTRHIGKPCTFIRLKVRVTSQGQHIDASLFVPSELIAQEMENWNV